MKTLIKPNLTRIVILVVVLFLVIVICCGLDINSGDFW